MNFLDDSVFITSNSQDVFYLTHKHIWKEKLFLINDDWLFLEDEESMKEYISKIKPKVIELDFSKITHKEFLSFQKMFPDVEIKNGNPITRKRRNKKPQEVEFLRKSADLNAKAMNFVISNLKPGITEIECANLYEIFIRENKAIKAAFDPICSFGSNTQFVHHKPTNRRLELEDYVTLDFGCILNHYASDMTRSFRFGKDQPSEFESIVYEAHKLALSMCRPLADFKMIQQSVDEFFKEKGVSKFRKHSLGHGIGLEVHEEPFTTSNDTILQEGMIVTIEPGLYDTGNYGFRYEDTILITKEGHENFYESWNRPR